jgi:hypothetical protein
MATNSQIYGLINFDSMVIIKATAVIPIPTNVSQHLIYSQIRLYRQRCKQIQIQRN